MIPSGKSDMPQQSRVSFLSKDMIESKQVGIVGYSSQGFRLLDRSFMFGPIAVFPKTVLSWRVLTPDDITEDSLCLFFLLQPKIDILVVGVGDRKNLDSVRKRVIPAAKKHRIGLELHTTEDAISTFNFLNAESRYVAAALYPPQDYHVTDDEYARAINFLEAYDHLNENPLFIGLQDTLVDPAKDLVRKIWGSSQPENVAKIEARVKEIRQENMKKRLPPGYPEPEEPKKLKDK
ncbi:Protein NUAF-3 a [Aphelenchoides avenae]|nr:Protein NUAF-3 a [Aphelenchus avenae]